MRTDTAALLLLPQNETPLYMLRSYGCLTAVPPSVADAVGPRSVPIPAPQVVKPLPVMHIAYVLSQRITARASGSMPGGGSCVPVMSLYM